MSRFYSYLYFFIREVDPEEIRKELYVHAAYRRESALLSDELREEKEKYKAVCDDMDATFAEMTGY